MIPQPHRRYNPYLCAVPLSLTRPVNSCRDCFIRSRFPGARSWRYHRNLPGKRTATTTATSQRAAETTEATAPAPAGRPVVLKITLMMTMIASSTRTTKGRPTSSTLTTGVRYLSLGEGEGEGETQTAAIGRVVAASTSPTPGTWWVGLFFSAQFFYSFSVMRSMSGNVHSGN